MFEEQINFKNETDKFKESPKAKTLNKKEKICWILKTHILLIEEDKNVSMALRAEYFQ